MCCISRASLQIRSVCCDPTGPEPWLRIDGPVDVPVLNTRGVKLEMQVSAEGAAGLADATDDLPGLYMLASPDGHGGHVRGHGGHAVPMLDRDMVAGPVTGVAGVEHDPRPHGANRCAMRGTKINPGVIAGPTPVFAKLGTNDGTRHRRHTAGTATAAGPTTAGRPATRTAVGVSAVWPGSRFLILRRALCGLPPVRRSHSSSGCPTQVLSRDSGSGFANRPVRIGKVLLPRITAGRSPSSTDFLGCLGQQLISLGSLLFHHRDLDVGSPGRAISHRRLRRCEHSRRTSLSGRLLLVGSHYDRRGSLGQSGQPIFGGLRFGR